jgi:hypothetical protein
MKPGENIVPELLDNFPVDRDREVPVWALPSIMAR